MLHACAVLTKTCTSIHSYLLLNGFQVSCQDSLHAGVLSVASDVSLAHIRLSKYPNCCPINTGWRYDGMLCQADNVETGAMWECPLLLELTQTEAKPKPSEQSTGGIQSINDSHTQLATPSGKAPTFRETHTQGGQTDKAVESQPGNFQESFGRSEPQPIASTSGKAGASAGGGISLLSRQLSDISLASREDSANAGAETQQAAAQQQQLQHTHLLCISPDAPINPVLYWLGAFDQQNTKFILEGAKGPLKLDLGDILYAPNLMIDGQVRLHPWVCSPVGPLQ